MDHLPDLLAFLYGDRLIELMVGLVGLVLIVESRAIAYLAFRRFKKSKRAG